MPYIKAVTVMFDARFDYEVVIVGSKFKPSGSLRRV